MKSFSLLTLSTLFTVFVTFGQELKEPKSKVIVDSKQYQDAKQAGTLGDYEVIPASSFDVFDYSIAPSQQSTKKIKGGITPKASGCNCYVEPDSSYILALAPNDDGFSAPITLPFPFCFYGDTVTTVFINNNGNVTFGNGLSAFSSSAFPSPNNQIIAPFWADVDTRQGNGQVVYKLTPTAMFINWEDVGYFSQQGDKRNTFQLILTNGVDPIIDGGNVAFCYEDMEWTTGSASGGINGFGGTPATAGANKGNNINFFLIARFDQPGSSFDGALGNNDGISWLDNKSFFFDVCNTSNIPPIPNGASSCDTFRVCSIGDTADVPFIFLSPETTQSTSIVINSPTLTNVQIVSNTPGNTATAVLRIPGALAFVGTHTINITATDNGVPAGVTNLNLTVIIDSTGTANFNPVISPTSGCDSVLAGVLGGPYESYLWDNLLLDSAIYIDSALQNFGVTVEKNGCYKRVTANFAVAPSFNFNLVGNNQICSNSSTTFYSVTDSSNYGSITWGLPNPVLDANFSNNLVSGNYTITVDDSLGICSQTQSINVTGISAIQLQSDTSFCAPAFTMNANSGGSGSGVWTSVNGPSAVFQNPTNLNTAVTFPISGTYNLVYTDNLCPDDDTIRVIVSIPFGVQLSGSPFFCPGTGGSLFTVADSARFGSVTWGSTPNFNGIFSQQFPVGSYLVTLVDTAGLCTASSTFNVVSQPDINLIDDTTICNGTFIMAGNTGGNGNGSWAVVSGPGLPTFQSSSALNQIITFQTQGVYVLQYTSANCPNSDLLEVNFSAGPPIVFNTVDFFVCPNERENIQLVDSTTLSSARWGLFNQALDTLFSVNLGVGTYTVEIVDLNGCESDSTFTIVSQTKINLVEIPNTCGDSLDLFGNVGVPIGQWSVLNSPSIEPVIFNTDITLQTSVSWPEPGIYTLRFGESVCNDADTITINVVFFPFSAVSNEIGCVGIPEQLTAFSPWNNITSYSWSNGQTGVSATFTEPGFYNLVSTNSCGTHVADFFYDARICDIEMPNVFTPNGDGANPLFTAMNLTQDGFASFNCKIFNRWGNLMYEFRDLTKGWDGTTNSGAEAADGVYFYEVVAKDIDNKDLNKQGFFHLVRN